MSFGFRRLVFVAVLTCAGLSVSVTSHADESLETARQYLRLGDATAAVGVLEPLLTQADANWQTAFFYGSAQLMLGQYELAVAYLDTALERRGDVAEVWVQRAVVEQELGRPEVALQLLEIARGLDSELPQVFLNIAYAQEALGDRGAARNAYREFLARTTGNIALAKLRHSVLRRLPTL